MSIMLRLAISFLIKNHPNLELVGTFSDPFQGLKAIFDSNIDFVFLDVLLENVNAFQILDYLELPATIILNSSWPKFSLEAKKYGIDNFLVKPIQKSNFETTVNKAISGLETLKKVPLNVKPYLVEYPNVNQTQED